MIFLGGKKITPEVEVISGCIVDWEPHSEAVGYRTTFWAVVAVLMM